MLRRHRPIVEGIMLALILGAALALRTTDLNRGMWQDEVLGYEAGAAVPLLESLSYQPTPAYHVLAYFAMYLSPDEWAFRLPSVITGIGGILLLYFLVRRTTGPVPALLSAAWLSVSTFHIASSVEARFYAVMMLIAPVIVETLRRALRHNQGRDWAWFVLAAVGGCLLQTTMLLFLFGIAVGGALWLVLERKPRTARDVAATLAPLTASVVAAAIPTAVLAGVHDYFRWFGVRDATRPEASEALTRPVYELSPAEYVDYFSWAYFPGLPMEVLAALWGLAITGAAYLTYRDSARASVLIAALILPPIPLFLIESTHFYHPRYFAWVVPLAIWLVLAGVHAAGLALGSGVQMLAQRLSISWLSRGAAGVGAALVGLVFAGAMLPHTISDLHRLDEQGLSAGLHEGQDNKRVTRIIRSLAAPHDFAHQFWARPDWGFYYRANLASYFVEPAPHGAPIHFWYLDGYGGRIDVNDLPNGAELISSIPLPRPYGRTLYQYAIPTPELRPLKALFPFCPGEGGDEADASFPMTIAIDEDGGEWSCASQHVPAMPHQYMEYILRAEGPPQIVLVLKSYDVHGKRLAVRKHAMRSPGAVREPHPAGASSPMPMQDGEFTLKFSTVTPPLTAGVSAEIEVEGDTRRGDQYTFHSVMVRGDWERNAAFHTLDLPPFGALDSGKLNWTAMSVDPAHLSIESNARTSALVVSPDVSIDVPFHVDSPLFPIDHLQALSVTAEYRGDKGSVIPELRFYDGEQRQLSWFGTEVEFYTEAQAFGRAENLRYYAGDNGWWRLEGTTAVPSSAAFAQLRLRVWAPAQQQIDRIESPAVRGF